MVGNKSQADIVVAVDSSSASQQAAQSAADLASKIGARVVLAHAVERRVLNSEGSAGPIKESADDAYQNGDELLESVERTLSTEVEVEHALLEGEPVSAFRDYLSQSEPEMIFIGHRALSEREEYLAGSFAKSLIGSSPVPVTVITGE